MKLILGSSSKYRRQVLEDHGLHFEIMSPDIDEKALRTDDFYKLSLFLARAKAEALKPRVKEPAIVIASDQIIVCGGHLHEKPADEEELRTFIGRYNEGYPAEVVSALVVFNTETGKAVEGVDIAYVHFNPIDEPVIQLLIKNDPYSKAGGFAIQFPWFEPYLKKVEGTVDSVMGMPFHLLEKLITEVS